MFSHHQSSSSSIAKQRSSETRLNTQVRPGRLPPIDFEKGVRVHTPPAVVEQHPEKTAGILSPGNLPSIATNDKESSPSLGQIVESPEIISGKHSKEVSEAFLKETDSAVSAPSDTFDDVIPPPTPPMMSLLDGNSTTRLKRPQQSPNCCHGSSVSKSQEVKSSLEATKPSRSLACKSASEVQRSVHAAQPSSSGKTLVMWPFKQFRLELEKWKRSKKTYRLQEFYMTVFDSFKSVNDTFKKQRLSTASSSARSEKNQNVLPAHVLDPGVQQKYIIFVYETLLQMSPEIQKLVLKGIINCLLNEWKSEKSKNDLRAYFVLLQNPMFTRISTYVVYAHLLRQVATLNEQDQLTLTHWLRRLGTPRFRPLIERLHQFVTLRLFPGQSDELPQMSNCGWWIPSAIKVLSLLNNANNMVRPRLVSFREFYNHTLDHIDVMAEFRQWESPASHSGFTFCHFPFVLSLIAKLKVLKHDQERQMIRTARDELVASIRRRPTRAPNVNQLFFNITVRRSHLLQDSLDQIYSNRKHLKKKLRVEFVGEPGYDMGGLTKEWFLLLLRKVLSPDYNTFTYNEKSRCYWFADNASENLSDLFLVGVLMGLAVYNCITLDIRLPMVCYRKLLSSVPKPGALLSHAADQLPGQPSRSKPATSGPASRAETPCSHPVGVLPVTLEDYRSLDPDMVHGLEELLTYEGNVEEDLDLTFQTSQNDFGVVRTVPLKPGGDQIPVTKQNRNEYVQAFLHYKLNKAVYRQFLAFHHGFYTVCCSNALSFLCPEELEILVCGNSGFDLRDLKKYTTYKGYVANDPTILHFWDVLLSLTRDFQKHFLHFCTGSDRVPVGGMQELNFKIVRTPTAQDMLPMAHTCFNQLLLPPYGSKQQLENKLVIAVSNAEGFGLQ